MKKIKLLALACAITGIGALPITSCSKSQTTTAPAKQSASTMSSSVDLNSYVTTFTKNADGSQSISFAEPEDIELSATSAAALNLKSATIPAGIYTINVTKTGLATLDFNFINVVEQPGGGSKVSVPMGLYIAKRSASCRDNNAPSYCLCGIGFRCGLSFSEVTPYLEQTYGTLVRTSQITGIHYQFNNSNIDWNGISQGL